MIISYNWLKQYIPSLKLNVEEVAKILTDTGLEVESIETHESVKGGLKGLIIAEVLEKSKHPDADRLSVTKVRIDEKGTIHQVVCGAANVAAGQKVVLALPGTTLFPTVGESFQIKTSKIRGVESAGMICAEDEIGLGQSHDGIMVLPDNAIVGTAASDYFCVSTDYVIHIGLTPNRIDAASHLGVARDLVAALRQRNGSKLTIEKPKPLSLTEGKGSVSVILQTTSCGKYCGVTIKNIKVNESPKQLKDKLSAIGLRSINNIVDITNFVMHECGQPLHAFDADKISGKNIIIRQANSKEAFTLLDGKNIILDPNDMVVADEKSALCLAGIYGGKDSGVSAQTVNVFLESAWFDSVSVRKTAKRHNLHTDSSFRFERGADPEMIEWALMRAAQMIIELAGGNCEPNYVHEFNRKFENAIIEFDIDRLDTFIGDHIDSHVVAEILNDLDFKILNQKGDVWIIEAPIYRVDVTRTVDVYEEILRIYGYNTVAIPNKTNATAQLSDINNKESFIENIHAFMREKGFFEIMNNSLNSKIMNDKIDKDNSVKIVNPLSNEMDVLRNSMLFGGLKAIAYNLNRRLNNLFFFENGIIYKLKNGRRDEQHQLAVFMTGKHNKEHWRTKSVNADVYSIKGICDAVISRFTTNKILTNQNASSTVLKNQINYTFEKSILISCGEVSTELLKQFDIEQPVFYAEIDLSLLMKAISQSVFRYKEISKFPLVKRDLSLVLDKSTSFEELKSIIKAADKNLIREVDVFDVYEGKNIGNGKKSYAISMIIGDESKTLTDDEVDKLMQKVIDGLTKETGAVLRG